MTSTHGRREGSACNGHFACPDPPRLTLRVRSFVWTRAEHGVPCTRLLGCTIQQPVHGLEQYGHLFPAFSNSERVTDRSHCTHVTRSRNETPQYGHLAGLMLVSVLMMRRHFSHFSVAMLPLSFWAAPLRFLVACFAQSNKERMPGNLASSFGK